MVEGINNSNKNQGAGSVPGASGTPGPTKAASGKFSMDSLDKNKTIKAAMTENPEEMKKWMRSVQEGQVQEQGKRDERSFQRRKKEERESQGS